MGSMAGRLSEVATILLLLATSRANKRLGSAPRQWTLDLQQVLLCPDEPGSVTFQNISQSFLPNSTLTSINGKVLVETPARSWSEMKAVTHKCRDGVTSNTCEYFYTFRHNANICGLWKSKIMPWAPLLKGINPNFECPLQAAWYTISNATVDINEIIQMFSLIPTNEIWQVKYTMLDEKQRLFVCMNILARLVQVRRRKN